MKKPTLGRIVIYEGCPAIIQGVEPDGSVSLWVFGIRSCYLATNVLEGQPPNNGLGRQLNQKRKRR